MEALVLKHNLKIEDNMDVLEAQIKKDIDERYNIVVTEDSLPDTKKLMAEINNKKDEFKKTYKSFKEAVLAPLVPLDTKAKKIEGYYDDARAALDKQVKNFEAKKLEVIKNLLEMHRDMLCAEREIDPDSVTVADLVKLTAVNVNKNGYTVAKGTADIIGQRIQTVENQILKAKIEAEEKAKRDREIAEKARQEAEAKAEREKQEIIAKAEREKIEAQQKAEREKELAVEKAKQEALESVKEAAYEPQNSTNDTKEVERDTPKEKAASKTTEDGRRDYCVKALFNVVAPDGIDKDKIIAAVTKKLLEAGVTTLISVEVVE